MDYKGYDYTELFDVLGIEPEEGRVFPDEMDLFKEALMGLKWDNDPVVVDEIRQYVEKMSTEDNGHWGRIWEGVASCEDDFTFMQACYALAEHMWT